MAVDYGTRALLLGFASFFLLQLLLGSGAGLVGRLSCWPRLRPAVAARAFLALRLLPAIAALVVTAGVILPAWFRWETRLEPERITPFLLAAAAAGGLVWLQSLARTGRALWRASRLPRGVVESPELMLAVAGFRQPRLIVSRGFLETVPLAQQEVARRHEMAHFEQGDNLKRLLLLLTPSLLPGSRAGQRSLEHAWAQQAERAADDRAVAGDPSRALLLAETLLRVAGHGSLRPLPLASTLGDSSADLRQRVERLIEPARQVALPASPRGLMGFTAVVGMTATWQVLWLWSPAVYQQIERWFFRP